MALMSQVLDQLHILRDAHAECAARSKMKLNKKALVTQPAGPAVILPKRKLKTDLAGRPLVLVTNPMSGYFNEYGRVTVDKSAAGFLDHIVELLAPQPPECRDRVRFNRRELTFAATTPRK